MVGRGLRDRLGLADRVLQPVALALVAEALLGPQPVDHVEPFAGPGVAVVMLVELQAILGRLVRPPGGDDVERQPAAADIVDVRRLLGEQGRLVEIGPDRDHQLDPLRHRRQRRRGRPGVERRLLDALDVVEVELGDQAQVPARLLAPQGEPADIVPARLHPLVLDVAQPAAEDRHPVTEPHHLPSRDRRLEKIDQPLVRVPAEHVQRIGDEIGQRVDVVEARRRRRGRRSDIRPRRRRARPPARSARPPRSARRGGVDRRHPDRRPARLRRGRRRPGTGRSCRRRSPPRSRRGSVPPSVSTRTIVPPRAGT